MKFIKRIFKVIIWLLAVYGVVTIGTFVHRIMRTQRTPYAQEVVGTTDVQPVVVLGAGPAGLAAAKTIADDHVPVLVLEGKQWGGPLNIFTPVNNWPGTGTTSGNIIISDLRAELESNPRVRFVARLVQAVDFNNPIKKMALDNGEIVHAQSVIITMGTQANRLNVPGVIEYASFISYEQKPQKNERGGTTVVVGGGVDAQRKALYRLHDGIQVVLVVRGSQLDEGIVVKGFGLYAGQERKDLLQKYIDDGKLTILYGSQIAKLVGDDQKLTAVQLTSGIEIPAQYIAVGMGRSPNTSLFKEVLDLDDAGYIVLKNHTQLTNVAGVFAAGDITSDQYAEGAIAAGDGMKAAKDALRYIAAH